MIQLKPIDSEVQKTLIEKIKQSGKKERPVGEPLSGDKGNYMQARTTWARMISLSVPKDAPDQPVVISAGEEMIDESRLSAGKLSFTDQVETTKQVGNVLKTVNQKVSGKTSKINGAIRGDFYDVYQKDNYNRPIAGLKGISTRIQGQSKAIRSAEIKWICWDFDTLERLTPYFLSPGVSVALEFGWMWPGHTPEEFIYDNWMKMDAKKIGDLSNVVRKKGKGNQELVYGIVKNFTWTGRDDGGFDCVTEIVSPSSNVFKTQMGDSEETPSFEIPADIRNQIRQERSVLKSREGEVKKIRGDDQIQKALKEEFPKASEEGIQNMPPKILFENFREILLNLKYIYEDGGVLGAGGDADWKNTIEGENEEFKDTILVEKLGLFTSNSNIDERYLGPYITYGWFEDNILSRFISKIHDNNKIGYQIRSVDKLFTDTNGENVYESVKINNDVNNLLTLNANEVIIPGQWPMDLDFATTEISGMSAPPPAGEHFQGYSTTRAAYISLMNKVRELPPFNVEPIDEDSLRGQGVVGKYKEFMRGRADRITMGIGGGLFTGGVKDTVGSNIQFRKLQQRDANQKLKISQAKDGEAPPQGKGYLRNLLINSKIIEEEMTNANTLEDGVMNLMKRISAACGNIWDFKLSSDPDNEFQVKVIEDSTTEQPVRNLLNNKSIDLATGDITEGYADDKGNVPNPGLMVFPTWQVNSIVHRQDMVTKLPSQMATAAIYGRNINSTEAASEDLSLEPAGKAIGKLFNSGMEEPKNPKDAILKSMERVLGNTKYKKWGYNTNTTLVPELNVQASYFDGSVTGIDLDFDEIVQIYTEKQIMEILEDGVPSLDEEGEPETFTNKLKKAFKTLSWVHPGLLLMRAQYAISQKVHAAVANWWEDGLDFRFLYTNNGKMKKHFKTALTYFLKQAPTSLERTKDVMTPIELSVTIDGTGGIFAGEAFSSTYIPKRYREACVFQIMDVAHELDSAGWKTTLRGLMRIDYGFGAKKPIVNVLKDMLKKQADIVNDNDPNTDPNDPPYLNFNDYLTKTRGRKSPFKQGPPKKEDTRTDEQKRDDEIRKNERENRKSD
tara:strand:+ start:6257 stop:9469 length:3213 start_codon:yes stop_codon:yes gene_type:complete